MSTAEQRWCADLLAERHRLAATPPVASIPTAADSIAKPLDFSAPGIAIFNGGTRVLIYPGEHETEETFSGEKLEPTERELRMNTHVSCFWDRSKVIRIEAA